MSLSPHSVRPPNHEILSAPGRERRSPLRFRPARARKRRRIHSHPVLSQEMFADALMREFRRAERFEESFALLLIAMDKEGLKRDWADLIEALTPTLSGMDLIGWFERDAVLGVVRPLIHLRPQEAAMTLAATVQRQVVRSLAPDGGAHCSIRLEVYSAASQTLTTCLPDKSRAQKIRARIRATSKRTLDLVGSLLLLTLCTPIFLIVAALMKLTSRGPVFFRQVRIGQAGRPFTMLKFRTMKVDADEGIHRQYMAHFIQTGHADKPTPNTVFKIVNDPRVTPIGHFLRRSSLDEIPQFWNVLRGDMSLVGPRPPLAYEVQKYKRWHLRRLWDAKPGITGLWQVKGRSRTTFDEMVRLDLQYAKKNSLWTDIKILLATPVAVVVGKGAH